MFLRPYTFLKATDHKRRLREELSDRRLSDAEGRQRRYQSTKSSKQ